MLDILDMISIDGANKKQLKRYRNNLVIIKERVQPNICDNVCEAMIYDLATILGVPCCKYELLDDDRVYSEVEEKSNRNLYTASEVFKADDLSIPEIYEKLERLNLNNEIKYKYIRMVLFDILTRQIDRNLTNFSFIKGSNKLDLYKLYDNGLSLFAMNREIIMKTDFRMRYGNDVDDTIIFCKKRLLDLNKDINKVFKIKLNKDILLNIWSKYEGKHKHKISEIIDWVLL